MSKNQQRPGGTFRRIATTLLLLGAAYLAQRMGWLDRVATLAGSNDSRSAPSAPRDVSVDPRSGAGTAAERGEAQLQELFREQRSGVMLTVAADVYRVLPDDDEGSRHQRFLLRLSDGQTVLVAHNIDLAPRVPLERGDRVTIHGQYEWNEEGGVLHWTHHDPGKRHEEGWIEHEGRRYE